MEQQGPVTLDALDRRLVHRLAEDADPDLSRLADEIGTSADDVRARDDERPFDLYLIDAELGEADGFTFVREGGSAVAAHTVMMLTSTSHLELAAKCRSLNVASYIVKPIEFEKFVETVHTLGYYWLLLNEPPLAGDGDGR